MTLRMETPYKSCVPIQDVNRGAKKCLVTKRWLQLNENGALEMDETTNLPMDQAFKQCLLEDWLMNWIKTKITAIKAIPPIHYSLLPTR